MSKGFFVPNSVSEDFVSNKKTAGGAYQWDQATQEVNLGKQAALQTVNKQYSSTINNAYSNYLASNRGIVGSNMGQGYKEAYTQLTQEQLGAQIADSNLNAANFRQEIGQNANAMQSGIEKAYAGEVANMDRVYKTANDYLGYLKSLTGSIDASKTYLSDDQMSLNIDDMYDTVFQAQPQDYLDVAGNIGMSYTEWVNSSLKSNEADMAWSKWLFAQGGLNQAKAGVKSGVKK